MAHWSDPYIGMPYVDGAFTCAHLVERVAADVLGLNVSLPKPSGNSATPNAQQHCARKDAVFKRVDAPVDAHPVVMFERGLASHIGVACSVGGAWYVLHAVEGTGVVAQPLSRVRNDPTGGIEGFYKWAA